MAPSAERQRAPAVCTQCGSDYTVYVLSDGDLEPIGTVACECGNDEFRIVE